jgi:hypothetical protein
MMPNDGASASGLEAEEEPSGSALNFEMLFHRFKR